MISLAGCCSSSHGETYFFSFAMHGKPARSPCYYYFFFWFSFYCYCCCPNPATLIQTNLLIYLSPSLTTGLHAFSPPPLPRPFSHTHILCLTLCTKHIRNSISIISIQSNKPASSPLSLNHSASPSTPCSCSTKKEPRANAPPAPAPAPAVTSNPTGGQSLAPAKSLKHRH